MDLIKFVLIIVLFLTVPVKIAATLLKAKNTGFFICFIASLADLIAMNLVSSIFDDLILEFVSQLVVSGIVYYLILGAKLVQSVLISLVSLVIMIGFGKLLIELGLGTISFSLRSTF